MIIVVILPVFAERFHTYDMELLNTFGVGRAEGEFKVSNYEDAGPGSGFGPSSFVFKDEDHLLILDTYNNRIQTLNNNDC